MPLPNTPGQKIGQRPGMPMSPKEGGNPWMIISIILAIALVGTLVYSFGGYGKGQNGLAVVPMDQAADELVDFLNQVYGPQIGPITLKEATEANGLYQITVTATDPQGQQTDQVVLFTRDGKLFIPQAINVENTISQLRTLQEQQQNAPIPTPDPIVEETPPSEEESEVTE